MKKQEKEHIIAEELQKRYPETKTFLHFSTDWQLLFAIILSAQATDISVNQATEILFLRLPELKDYNEENRETIHECIKKVGLGKSKTEYLIETAKELLNKYDGKVPTDRKRLMKLSGVGFKTSGVFLGEFYNIPFIPVDTHVYRVSHRLGLVPQTANTPLKVEQQLMRYIPVQDIPDAHHWLLLHGRYICRSNRPLCGECPFDSFCPKRFDDSKL